MSPDHLSAILSDVISRLDTVAVWLGDADGDLQASAEISLVAEKLHNLRLLLEREQFARVPEAVAVAMADDPDVPDCVAAAWGEMPA